MSGEKLIVVSNRGPFKLARTKSGVKRNKHIGGLVTSVLPMMMQKGGVWVAWGEPEGRFPDTAGRSNFTLRQLGLSREQEQGFYRGVANSALWPLCHSFLGRVRYDAAEWKLYEEVNRLFAAETLAEMEEGDLVWVHDYQLALVPRFLRADRPTARLAFFWHIPFPPPEIFRTFPWRRQLLEGLLANGLVGFHIPEYAENFREAAAELLGAEVDGEFIHWSGRWTRVMARPIGIDYQGVERLARQERVQKRVQGLKQALPGQVVLLGVERMDYTKGILERLRAMENLLDRNPGYIGAVTLIQIVTPSRQTVTAYQQKKREIDETVGRINGRFSNDVWIPIRYLYRSFTLNDLVAYYCLSDVALITPLRDGLNLVAKEFAASRLDGDGALILSEFAGVAKQLPEAIPVNPYSIEEMTDAMERAIRMPNEEQRRRMRKMQDRIRAQDIAWWTEEFLDAMRGTPAGDQSPWMEPIKSALQTGGRVWIFLDFDGTLVPIARSPEEAVPDRGLLDLLSRLAGNGMFRPVILSGRPLSSLRRMFPINGLMLAGTYGIEIQTADGTLLRRPDTERLRPALETIAREWKHLTKDRAGFLIEDKGMAVALHARFADEADAQVVLKTARAAAETFLDGRDFRLLGGDRFLEAAPANASKRRTVDWLLDGYGSPRMLPVYFGDDDKDEEAFGAVRRRGGIPVVVGSRQPETRALIRLQNPQAVRERLEAFLDWAARSPDRTSGG
ncbi:MAG: bifunctional alpha,alpha-trehalose-phosphate synthase (UDP-forming)/trehalose-phosphatase [Anaerolineales bacterium]|nr:bifunctional alpha,alpha-trehalose-phosphate synthase (UDP-forming)/trehalose-phosphatase [Anaerolineales bacterium]